MSNYARRMAHLSARIFGELHRPTKGADQKVMRMFREKPLNKNKEVVEYYPNHPKISGLMSAVRYLGLYRDEHRDFKEEMQRLRALRGKAKPKKGEGKRALKRK